MNPAVDNDFNSQNATNPMSNLFNNVSELKNKFNKFKSELTGDPKQTVEGLISSGRMSKAQFEQFSQVANSLRNVLH